jgi:hypothetical protein
MPPERESIEFDGILWHRYPNAKQRGHRTYYTSSKGALHKAVYERFIGPVPDGAEIHHIPTDDLQDTPSALHAYATKKAHRAQHPGNVSEAQRLHLERIRPKASEWHKSEEGRDQHRSNARRGWQGVGTREVVCSVCGAPAITRYTGTFRYCSRACAAAAYGAERRYEEERHCLECQKPFMAYKYHNQRWCGRSCAMRAARKAYWARRRLQS